MFSAFKTTEMNKKKELVHLKKPAHHNSGLMNKKKDETRSYGLNAANKDIKDGWPKIVGEKIEDLEAYIFNYLADNKDNQIELMIGTDGLARGLG